MKLQIAKVIALVFCFGILTSNLVSMSHWTEDRGVNDDICYLRQAHLFQKFGPVGGLDTSLAKEDDGYLLGKLRLLPGGWDDKQMPPCHTHMLALDKWVLQYPPGTGFVLSLFPAGSQVVPLFVGSTLLIFAFAAAAILRAQTQATLAVAAVSGAVALYMMINPTKASYSMAPTMVICAAAGWLTAYLFNSRREPALVWITVLGVLLGLAVNIRVANLFLSAGYAVFLFGTFVLRRDVRSFATGCLFGAGLLLGMLPTLAANAINAGSPFSTTYSSGDAQAPQLDWSTLKEYAGDPQFALLLLALGWTALLWRVDAQRRVAQLVFINLAINIAFFATHPVFTPYYTIPSAAISLWTLLFATVERGTGIKKSAAA